MNLKVAIIGKGNVGSALARGLQRTGVEVKTVGYMLKMGTQIGFKLVR